MVDFELTPVQRNVQEMVHWFAATKVRPVCLEADRTGRYPDSLYRALAAIGLAQGMVPQPQREAAKAAMAAAEALGEQADARGAKQTNRLAIIAAEEMAWGDPAILTNIPGPGLGAPPVRATGTPEQQERFFGIFRDTSVPRWGAYGLSEPGAGSDVAAISTTAVRDGDSYVLNGTKCFITNGARASWVVVFATVDKSRGRAGHRAFVVEQGTPGFRVGRIEEKMGLHAQETAELVFEDCRVPRENLLGGEAYYEQRGSAGFKIAMQFFDTTRPMVAILAVGIARAAFECARDFVKANAALTRPLPRHGQILDMLGTMAREIQAARLLAWKAAWMADEGRPNSREASMAKAYAAQIAMRTCINAVQLMGPRGAVRGSLVEKLFRDVKVFDIFEGTGQVQRIVISRRIFEQLGGSA
jgi:acyl-CoA dehydrogenase